MDLNAVISLGALGIIFGFLLAYAAQRFAVKEDPRVEAIKELLPGANCGACGYPGCSSFAESVVSGEAPTGGCVAGGQECAANICSILGSEPAEEAEEMVAVVACVATKDVAKNDFEYDGVPDCKAAMMYGGGFRSCKYGCLGLGTCVAACPFDALTMGDDGLPIVDINKCTGCGICRDVCPRDVIKMVPKKYRGKIVRCNNKDKGKTARLVCDVGCIGCKACVKVCPNDAIEVKDNLAYIDVKKCDNCGECLEKCTRSCIVDCEIVELEEVS